nr:MAG TPA: hypothetical protein [Caudoviricetes sp.]
MGLNNSWVFLLPIPIGGRSNLTMLFSVRRTRSQLRYRAVQGGLGVLPTTSRRARVLTQALLATIN